jgi:hypothetical protein
MVESDLKVASFCFNRGDDEMFYGHFVVTLADTSGSSSLEQA